MGLSKEDDIDLREISSLKDCGCFTSIILTTTPMVVFTLFQERKHLPSRIVPSVYFYVYKNSQD